MEFLGRRTFLKGAFSAALLPMLPHTALMGCFGSKKIKTTLHGAEHSTGHMLRNSEFSSLSLSPEVEEVDVLILGGGVSGLSARYFLAQKNPHVSVLLLEHAPDLGGNARSGIGPEGGRYPWGAHYLPLPSPTNTDLLKFLEKAGVITGYSDDGSPQYHEDYLIHAPESVLHEYGQKTDGLRPKINLSPKDSDAFRRFNALIKKYSNYLGSDSKRAFGIPLLSESSRDRDILELDSFNTIEFLNRENLVSEKLEWYINYATRDDYGSLAKDVSAWAALHYFCSRDSFLMKGAENRDLLTWPEGNSFLVDALIKAVGSARSEIRTNALAIKLERDEKSFIVEYLSLGNGQRRKVRADKVIGSVPEFIFKRMLSDELGHKFIHRPVLEYVPWLIVNLTIPKLPYQYSNIPWDSVSIHTPDLGFVRSDHQTFSPGKVPTVLTFYYPLAERDPKEGRKWLLENDPAIFTELACQRLDAMYPGLSRHVSRSDIWYWGHGMAKPKPGIISSRFKEKDLLPPGIVYAHTDQSVISVFEEAFYQGKTAAVILK